MYHRSYEGYEDDEEDEDEEEEEDEDEDKKNGDESKGPCNFIKKYMKKIDSIYPLIKDEKSKNVQNYIKFYTGEAYANTYKSAIDNKCITKLSDEKMKSIRDKIGKKIKKKNKKSTFSSLKI